MQYWFLSGPRMGAAASINLMSLRDVDILGTGTVAVDGVGAVLPAAPAGTIYVAYRNTVSMRALISRFGTLATAAHPFLPAIGQTSFSNLSQISPGEIMAVIEAP
jgi:hypothetical protein